jgi:cell wall-associated NlpC family hydrolase
MWGVKNRVKPPSVPPWEDCSSYSTWTYWVAKIPDPNNLGYNGYGYTGTLASNGKMTYNPKPGDLAFYGAFPYSHVVIFIGNAKCISHGSEGGPYLLPVKYRSDFSHYRTYF